MAAGSSILQSLGCWTAFLANGFLESFGTRAAWGSPEAHENDFLFSLRGNGCRLDRARFDAMLLNCAHAAGVEIRSGRIIDSIEDSTGWRLQFRGFECHARFVIDATGRSAAFGVQRGVRRVPGDRLADVFVLFETEDAADLLIEAVETGWCYSATVPGSTAVAAFMTDTDLMRGFKLHHSGRWNELLSRAFYTRERLRAATPKAPPAVFAAHSQHLSPMGGRGGVASGDAAMGFDPLSSQGIIKALRSGKLASFVAADFLLRGMDSHGKYEKIALAELDSYRKTWGDYYGMEQRWPNATFWTRRR
jgi:flavin-dependent dehydrogenase